MLACVYAGQNTGHKSFRKEQKICERARELTYWKVDVIFLSISFFSLKPAFVYLTSENNFQRDENIIVQDDDRFSSVSSVSGHSRVCKRICMSKAYMMSSLCVLSIIYWCSVGLTFSGPKYCAFVSHGDVASNRKCSSMNRSRISCPHTNILATSSPLQESL